MNNSSQRMARPGRPISSRLGLLRNVLLLVLLLSAAILAATYLMAERSIDTLSRAAMRIDTSLSR